METKVYRVPGMSCAHCERAVEAEVRLLTSVADVHAEAATKIVRVAGTGVSDRDVREAIVRAGYEAE